MKRLKNLAYYIRILFFILQFVFLFLIEETLLQVRPLVYLFLFVYTLFVIKILVELLSKKKNYREDTIYNIMQIGLFIYIFILFYYVYIKHIIVRISTMSYFNTNLIIMCILMIFIVLYSCTEVNRKKRK